MPVTCEQMRALEAAAVAGGASEDALMEEAGRGIARAVQALVAAPDAVVIFAGKGHNAGDALVAARHWLEAGWRVVVCTSFPKSEWRPLTSEKWRLVADRVSSEIPTTGRLLLVDGLLGLGSAPGLRAPVLDACRQLNALRRHRHATTVAVDGPTGVDFDTGQADADAVQADITTTVAVAKRGLLAEEAVDHVGRLVVVLVPVLEPSGEVGPDGDEVLTPHRLRPLLRGPRPFNFHKGQAGRVLVVAGSRGMLGAGRMCAAAAVHGGAGLVTLAVPKDVQDVAASSLPPEIMIRGYREFAELADVPADVLAVGPGLGRRDDAALAVWLARDTRPAVVDADALNALAALGSLDGEGAGAREARTALSHTNRLVTPHPGEMNRLLAAWHRSSIGAPRARQARGLADELGAVVLLKGARTVIAASGHPLAHNTTGHPGMASGGMGDVLTGLSAALMAQGCNARPAGCLGSWLLGRAAEIALAKGHASPESLRASLVLDHLGSAFDALRFGEV